MPIRHDDDYRRKQIRSWDSWVDEAILEAQERGDFDDLPLHGKPITIVETPFAPDMNAALTTLKNAGYAPTWMELDRDITQLKAEMESFLERSAAYLRKTALEIDDDPAPEDLDSPERRLELWSRLKRFLNFAADIDPPVRRQLSLDDLVMIRTRMRDQYLDRAAAVDKKVTEFHTALPRNLWHLERMRLTPASAAKTFDAACPSLLAPGPGALSNPTPSGTDQDR